MFYNYGLCINDKIKDTKETKIIPIKNNSKELKYLPKICNFNNSLSIKEQYINELNKKKAKTLEKVIGLKKEIIKSNIKQKYFDTSICKSSLICFNKNNSCINNANPNPNNICLDMDKINKLFVNSEIIKNSCNNKISSINNNNTTLKLKYIKKNSDYLSIFELIDSDLFTSYLIKKQNEYTINNNFNINCLYNKPKNNINMKLKHNINSIYHKSENSEKINYYKKYRRLKINNDINNSYYYYLKDKNLYNLNNDKNS